MLSKGIVDLNRLKARATALLSPGEHTTLHKLVSLRQKASEILLGWGPNYRDIRLAIEALDFEPDCPAPYKNRPIGPDTQPMFGPNRYNQERYSAYLRDVLERFIRLIAAAQGLMQSESNAAIPARSTTPTLDTSSQTRTPTRRPRQRKPSNRGRGRTQPPRLSTADIQRYQRIGKPQIETLTNRELWTRWRSKETHLRRNINYQAFRHSLNRIRVQYDLPSSRELQKKVTSLGHLQGDQE